MGTVGRISIMLEHVCRTRSHDARVWNRTQRYSPKPRERRVRPGVHLNSINVSNDSWHRYPKSRVGCGRVCRIYTAIYLSGRDVYNHGRHCSLCSNVSVHYPQISDTEIADENICVCSILHG
jgi:hypothetical protein